jgi:hypothetical protein
MPDNIRFLETGQATVLARPWPLDLVITTHAATTYVEKQNASFLPRTMSE